MGFGLQNSKNWDVRMRVQGPEVSGSSLGLEVSDVDLLICLGA